MKLKLVMLLIVGLFILGTVSIALAEAPVYVVEVRHNPPDPLDFTGHKRFSDIYPVVGDTWTEHINVYGVSVPLHFKVMSDTETVETPAGLFENCVLIRVKIQLWPIYDDSLKYWNAEGVGQVKSYSSFDDKTQLLVNYNIEGGYGYDPIAIGNWWLFDDDSRPAIVAYEEHLGYNCFRFQDQDAESMTWVEPTGVPGPDLPDVYVAMMPDYIPVTTFPGGSFNYTATLGNTTSSSQISDVWLMLNVPGYGLYGPIDRFDNISIAPNSAIVVSGVTQDIPTFAPLGVYNYIAYCGDYPSDINDEASFEFTVVPESTGTTDSWGVGDWFKEKDNSIPTSPISVMNYPNPFNSSTEIKFDLPHQSFVNLEVYNIIGEKVETLINGPTPAGEHSIVWDASNASSGIYFYRLSTEYMTVAKRMILLK